MAKSIVFGNGVTLIGLDRFGQIKDLYYHYPGLQNHVTEARTHKIGVFVDDTFSWVDDGTWIATVLSAPATMASDITLACDRLGVELHFEDVLYNEKNIFVREIKVRNLYDRGRRIKLFFNAQFDISQTHAGETAFFDPRGEVIVHYKGRRVFLMNLRYQDRGFSEYSVGLLGIEGHSGTYKDAEDGNLSGNPIEHGQVDSVVGVEIEVFPKTEATLHYFLCIAKSINYAKKLNDLVIAKKPENIIKSTKDYWKAWVGVRGFSFYKLGKEATELFNKSLIYMRTHTGRNGGIIASGDSEMLQFGRDYYEYVWPRDAAYTAVSLAKAGDFNSAKKFFDFAKDTLTPEGYFMHKYRPDKSLGASWHPWVRGKVAQFPIQEDETAIVIWALWEYYRLSHNLEFVESVFNPLVKKAADFMASYTDDKTGLPKASYDLWEQVYGISTYTASSVYGALVAASKFARLLGKKDPETKYLAAAERIKKAIIKYLYDKDGGYFYKLIDSTGVKPAVDATIDFSSVFGVYKFEVLPIDDLRLKSALEKSINSLGVKSDVGGVARYLGDAYHATGGNFPGNPWIITTMWLAQYYIQIAKKESDFEKVIEVINWAVKRAGPSGILPEQVHPETGEHLSASPLTWSHAEYVTTVVNYLEKLEELGICKACYSVK